MISLTVATLTLRVRLLTEHLKLHRKDKSCLRTLIQIVQRRRRLLLMLKEFRPNAYHRLLTDLQLKPPTVNVYHCNFKNRRPKKILVSKGRSKKTKLVSG